MARSARLDRGRIRGRCRSPGEAADGSGKLVREDSQAGRDGRRLHPLPRAAGAAEPVVRMGRRVGGSRHPVDGHVGGEL